MKTFIRIITASLLAISLLACTEQKPTTGLYMLLDTAGTYTKELKKAQQIIHYYLANLEPGDSFAVARIDSVVAKLLLCQQFRHGLRVSTYSRLHLR